MYHDYALSVKGGHIVAGKYVKLAVDRYLDDLEKQSDDDFPYTFSEQKADAACNAIPALFRHSIGEHAGQPFVLESWQQFAVANIFGWQRKDGRGRRFRRIYWSMGRKNGKAETLDSVLPTPTGTTTMGEVEKGDYLIGRDGEPVRVLATSEIWEDRPVYQVEFSDGEVVECDGNHEWVYLKRHKKGGNGEKRRIWFSEETVETKWLAKQSLSNRQGAKFRIPNAVVQGQHRYLPIDPYTLGAWLGDGATNGQRITCHRDDLPNLLENIDGFETRLVSNGGKGRDVRVVSMLGWNPAARGIGVLGNKHIPEVYFTASVEQRIALLQGLMDTDGTISKEGQCEFTQKKGRLATDVKRLLASIGIYSKCKTSDMKLDGKIVGERQRITFFPPDHVMPFRLARKAKRVCKRKKDGTRKIVRVEYVRQDRTKCVQVEGGVYMTGNYVLTHNSTIAAAISILMAGFDINPTTGEPEARAQVILAATKREQAEKVIMAEILRMRHQSPIIRGGSHVANKLMTFEHNGGNIQAVGSDRPYDGLNPALVVMDETHAWTNQHRRFYDTMKTGSGSRVQPLTMTVTTAGDDQSHLWIEEVGFAKAVLDKTVNDEGLYAAIYEIDEGDDPFSEDCWIKANPNLGVSISMEFLRSQIEPAKTSPQALNRFKRYHANILVSSTERIFSLEDYDKCKGELSDWREAEAVGAGIDLSGRDDLAAAAFVARFPTKKRDSETGLPIYRYEIRCKSYISANTPRDLTAVPFCNWIDDGLIKVTQTPMVDLQDEFIEDYWNYYCSDCAIDPYQAQQFGEQVSQQGIVIATMPQTQSQFNEPISEFRQAMADGRIRHDGNPLLRWCLSNAVAVRDRSDRWMLDKANSSQKIDPLVATIMAFRRAMVAIGRGGGHFIT